MNCEVIERGQELKYLGMTFDRSLSFSRHIDNTISKAKKGIGAVRTMANALMPQRILFLMMQLVVLHEAHTRHPKHSSETQASSS